MHPNSGIPFSGHRWGGANTSDAVTPSEQPLVGKERHLDRWSHRELCREVVRLESALEEAREALRFYAEKESYREQSSGTRNSFGIYDVTECPIWNDSGEIARRALRD